MGTRLLIFDEVNVMNGFLASLACLWSLQKTRSQPRQHGVIASFIFPSQAGQIIQMVPIFSFSKSLQVQQIFHETTIDSMGEVQDQLPHNQDMTNS